MFKRLFFAGLLCIGVLGFTAASVHAYPATFGGWGAWPGSVTIWSDWKGVADYDKKPTNITVTIEFLEVQVHYINPGGNGGGLGQPFYPDATLSHEEGLGDGQEISKNGRFFSEIPFTDQEIYDAIKDYIPPPPNPNWTWDDIIVLRMRVIIEGFSDWDGDGVIDDTIVLDPAEDFSQIYSPGDDLYNPCDTPGLDWGTEATSPTVYVRGVFELNYDHTAYHLVNTEVEWYWKKNDPVCPVKEDNNPYDDLNCE